MDLIKHHMTLLPGSAVYFSLRKVPKNQRELILLILAFYLEIEEITLSGIDANVAHFKLNWWRDEVVRIQDGTPSHPLALALQKKLSAFPFSPLRLIELIDGLEQNLTLPEFATFEEVMIHFMRTAGQREILMADILTNGSQLDIQLIYQLAFVIDYTHYLQHLRNYSRRGLIFFPQDELRRFDLTRDHFLACKTTEAMKNFFAFQAEKIQRAFQQNQISQQLSQNEFRPLMIRGHIAIAVLEALQSSHFSMLENFIDITPLRRWWISMSS